MEPTFKIIFKEVKEVLIKIISADKKGNTRASMRAGLASPEKFPETESANGNISTNVTTACTGLVDEETSSGATKTVGKGIPERTDRTRKPKEATKSRFPLFILIS